MRSRVSAGIVLASILAVITLTGCYSAPIMPPTGMLYNDTAAPMNMGGAEMFYSYCFVSQTDKKTLLSDVASIGTV